MARTLLPLLLLAAAAVASLAASPAGDAGLAEAPDFAKWDTDGDQYVRRPAGCRGHTPLCRCGDARPRHARARYVSKKEVRTELMKGVEMLKMMLGGDVRATHPTLAHPGCVESRPTLSFV